MWGAGKDSHPWVCSCQKSTLSPSSLCLRRGTCVYACMCKPCRSVGLVLVARGLFQAARYFSFCFLQSGFPPEVDCLFAVFFSAASVCRLWLLCSLSKGQFSKFSKFVRMSTVSQPNLIFLEQQEDKAEKWWWIWDSGCSWILNFHRPGTLAEWREEDWANLTQAAKTGVGQRCSFSVLSHLTRAEGKAWD